jgi:hypothetical protein
MKISELIEELTKEMVTHCDSVVVLPQYGDEKPDGTCPQWDADVTEIYFEDGKLKIV